MKKHFLCGTLFCCVCCTISLSVNAQVKVANDGKVGIYMATNLEPHSLLTVGDSGIYNAGMSVYKTAASSSVPIYGIYTRTGNTTSIAKECAVYGTCIGSAKEKIGVAGEILGGGNSGLAKLYGVFGSTTASTASYNYGIYGQIKENASGNGSGTGIFGSNENSPAMVVGRYAGYFKGKSRVDGTLTVTTLLQTSDVHLKTNIINLSGNALTQVNRLRPVQYNWLPQKKTITTESATITEDFFSKDTNFERKHYGFIAQEVQKLFPDLVHENEDGYLSMNYMELIPLLVQAIQELSAKVDALEKQNKK